MLFRSGNTAEQGGAVALSNLWEGSISNSTFIRNEAMAGGAVYFEIWTQQIKITHDCLFMENTASLSGGAIFMVSVDKSETIAIENCTIKKNTAKLGGSYPIIEDIMLSCLFFYRWCLLSD